jgi:hypothetical protein
VAPETKGRVEYLPACSAGNEGGQVAAGIIRRYGHPHYYYNCGVNCICIEEEKEIGTYQPKSET